MSDSTNTTNMGYTVLRKKKITGLSVCGIISGIIMAVAALIPVLRLDFFNEPMYLNLLEYPLPLGIIVLICAVSGVVLSVMGKNVFCIIPGALSLGVIAAFHITLNKMLRSVGTVEISRMFVKLGPGYFLLLVAALGLIAVGIVGMVKERSNFRTKEQ